MAALLIIWSSECGRCENRPSMDRRTGVVIMDQGRATLMEKAKRLPSRSNKLQHAKYTQQRSEIDL